MLWKKDPTSWRHRPRHAATAVGLALMVATTLAAVHEEGVLKLATRALVAGDTVPVKGEKFTKNSPLSLALVGVSGRLNLARVRADSRGAFAAPMLIPADASPGSYRLVAIAEDGDEVASLDVTVAAAAAAADHGTMPGHGAMATGDPSSEPLALDRARNPLLTGGVVAGIVVALAVSGMLFRRRPAGGS